jgi:hypothetical protein
MNTFKRDHLPVIAAVLAAFVVSTIWYSPLLFGKQWVALRSQWMRIVPDPHIASWKPWVELARETIVAYVFSRLFKQQAIDSLKGALSLGFWVWLGFPVTMMVGASLWDHKPWVLGLIHGGDWFTKMLVMAAVIMFTRRLASTPQLNYVPDRLSRPSAI